MKTYRPLLIVLTISICNSGYSQQTDSNMKSQTDLSNPKVKNHTFLECMYNDPYFPNHLVDKCKNILINLSLQIENEKPEGLTELYALTHKATDQLNDLQEEFYENDSEIETAARECLAAEFEFISVSYGFEADIEELIATRDW